MYILLPAGKTGVALTITREQRKFSLENFPSINNAHKSFSNPAGKLLKMYSDPVSWTIRPLEAPTQSLSD